MCKGGFYWFTITLGGLHGNSDGSSTSNRSSTDPVMLFGGDASRVANQSLSILAVFV